MASLNNKVSIYSLSDPITNEIRYIGKTENELQKRLNDHISLCIRGVYKSKCRNWIKSVLNKGTRPLIEKVDSVDNNDWEFWEKYWISQFRAWGFSLTNMTPGGDGFPRGYIPSNETRLKISLASKKIKNRKDGFKKGMIPWNKGKKMSSESRLKLSKANLGHHHSEEAKRKISDAGKGRIKSKESIEKFIKTRRENDSFRISDRTKDKISGTLKRRYSNKEIISPFKHLTKEQRKNCADAVRNKLSKKILCTNIKNGNKTEFNSLTDAAKKLPIGIGCIVHSLKGRSNIVGKKYKFNYL